MDVDHSCCVTWTVIDDVRLVLVCESIDFGPCSPVFSILVKFNGTMGEGSPYVGKGPEVDEAWHKISYDIGDQMITPEELKIIGMPESSLKVKHPQTGVEGYRVGLEVFHQLHCLNLLRQVTYKEYYTEIGNGNFASGDEELQMHTGKLVFSSN
ncbi:hypothetical protein M7I_2047 [Glarea lozoyensis 74030]|uniref:Uncharacterized protein n=1 Tax=Glarea lozoyensis (strain ATCC 74030 / MF5533) TaxID=1104152 RepID=H0EHR2_GLAL7|nr:hypothetical protein M7I_2047 [Glarea lozoyensis 74030]